VAHPITSRTTAEQRVLDAIEQRTDELVALTTTLIGFDTTARGPDDPPRDERALQEHLAARLRAAGAEVDLWEPRPEDVAGRQVRTPLSFAGRPQLAATFGPEATGRSLLFNGHIDAVSHEPADAWTSPPLQAQVRDGRLYGRGACDMKGGVAAMVVAAETLAALGVRLDGPLVVNTVTDEESTGAGGIATIAHGVRADAAVVPEPTGFDVWIACRGTITATITVHGRAGHAEMSQPHWREGGAVNAIEKAQPILAALERLREDWRLRPDHRHPHVSPAVVVPTMIQGGEWFVSYPASCEIVAEVAFPPTAADPDGWGDAIRAEVTAAVRAAAQTDTWLRDAPPSIAWGDEYPACQVDPGEPIVGLALQASADTGAPGALDGLDSWHDGATFTRAGCPALCLGPGGIESAHAVDEYVPVADLVRTAQALALIAMRFCGTTTTR
jgi:acetylornithine deacetylase